MESKGIKKDYTPDTPYPAPSSLAEEGWVGVYEIQVTDQEFELFRRLIYENSGINLTPAKKNLLQTRLMKRLKLRGCNTFSRYYRYIKNDLTGEEMIAMLNAISTNLTKFFREEDHFIFLYHSVLPELTARKRKEGDRKLRFWSAACSSGEEAYSIGMTLLGYIETPLVWDIKILATDISTNILNKAAEGAYEADKINNIPTDMLTTFFEKYDDDYYGYYNVKPVLRDLITFRRLNLIDDHYPFKGKFDLIFCRNVMIYFDKATQEQIVNRFYRFLEDGGYLFIGHSESLNGVKSPFEYLMPAVYRKSEHHK